MSAGRSGRSKSNNAPVLPISSQSQSSTGFASYSSAFAARSAAGFFRQAERSSSPTRVHIVGAAQPAPTVRFAIDSQRRPSISPGVGGSLASSFALKKPARRRTCMCSPTSHPGSFRCSLHKGQNLHGGGSAVSSPSNRLNMRRSAMTNSLVRIGTVEGDLVRRALTSLIRPSSHQQRRRFDFQHRPTRLSNMSKAD